MKENSKIIEITVELKMGTRERIDQKKEINTQTEM